MATTNFYLDKRRPPRHDGTYPLRIAINHGTKTLYITLNIFLKPTEWDGNVAINRQDKGHINTYIYSRKEKVDQILLHLVDQIPSMTIAQLKERVMNGLAPQSVVNKKKRVSANFLQFANQHGSSTKEIYMATYRHLERFMGDALADLTFEGINRQWLVDFDNYLAKTSPSKNARNIHLRNIRAVFNDAIDNGITQNYPFRKFKIKPMETPKRSLAVDELRALFNYPVEPHQRQYLDMFKLIFYLCGINIIDLYNLKKIVKGRVEYYRSKTHKLYSVKVEPEAMAIIENYKGESALLDIADRYNNYKDYRHRLNENLQRIGKVERVGLGGKKIYTPLFPDLTTYWARHTWATIAASLDIPKETIAAALGHEIGNPVTSIYIRFEQAKVDEANRRVIDHVLYGK